MRGAGKIGPGKPEFIVADLRINLVKIILTTQHRDTKCLKTLLLPRTTWPH